MRNRDKIKHFGVIAAVVVIGILMSSCADPNPVEAETLTGFKEAEGRYFYQFGNSSDHTVTVQIGGSEFKVLRGKTVYHNSSSKTLTFKYAPANRVKYSIYDGGQVDFFSK